MGVRSDREPLSSDSSVEFVNETKQEGSADVFDKEEVGREVGSVHVRLHDVATVLASQEVCVQPSPRFAVRRTQNSDQSLYKFRLTIYP
jgi:hypothetical protein